MDFQLSVYGPQMPIEPGFSLGLDDMEGDLSPPYGGGQVQGDKAVIGGDGWGGTYTLWGGTHTSNSF